MTLSSGLWFYGVTIRGGYSFLPRGGLGLLDPPHIFTKTLNKIEMLKYAIHGLPKLENSKYLIKNAVLKSNGTFWNTGY